MIPEPQDFPRTDADVPAFLAALDIPGIVDVHVHAMPERLQRAVWRYFEGLSDPPWPVAYRAPLDERLATLRALGVRAHTALAYPHRPGMLRWLNDFTLGLADRVPQVVPTFTVFPEDGVAGEVARCLGRGGRAVKVHLQVGRFHATDPRLDEAWGLIADAALPVVLHASAVYGVDGGAEYCGAERVAALLDRHPGLTLVVAHLGMPDFDDFVSLAEGVPELYLDLSMALTDPPPLGTSPLPPPLLARLRSIHRQLLFGSDFPTIPQAYAAQVRGLAALELDTGQLAGILHDRAARLLGLDPVGGEGR